MSPQLTMAQTPASTAEAPPKPPLETGLVVHFQPQAGHAFVVTDAEGAPREICAGACDSTLPPGRYKVSLRGPNGRLLKPSTELDLSVPSRVDGDVESVSAGRTAGALSLMTVPGWILMTWLGVEHKREGERECSGLCDTPPDPDDRTQGIRMIVSGVILTAGVTALGTWLLTRRDRARIRSSVSFSREAWTASEAATNMSKADADQLAAVTDSIRSCQGMEQPITVSVDITAYGSIARFDVPGTDSVRACVWEVLRPLRFLAGPARSVSFTY